VKVLVRVDGSTQIGSGHVMRCLTLATELKGKGFDVQFVCRDHPGQMSAFIESSGLQCNLLPRPEKPYDQNELGLAHSQWLGVDYRLDAEQTIAICGNTQFDWLVVDHYGIDYRWHGLLREYCKKILVIDDLADRRHDCDLLLDQTYGRGESIYDQLVPHTCRKLTGTQYALLRPEFAQLRPKALQSRAKSSKTIENILVFMGGADKDNLSSVVLSALSTITWPAKPKINLVVGLQSKRIDQLASSASSLPLDINLLRNVDNMADLMAEADLAIGAGGTTSWERCCLGLPSLVCIVAENQRVLTEALDKQGALMSWKTKDDLVKQLKKLIDTPQLMQEMFQVSADICDGEGCQRVVACMINQVENAQ